MHLLGCRGVALVAASIPQGSPGFYDTSLEPWRNIGSVLECGVMDVIQTLCAKARLVHYI